jgi:hypothetical protein
MIFFASPRRGEVNLVLTLAESCQALPEIILHEMQVGLIRGPAVEAGIDDATAGRNGGLVAEIACRFQYKPGRIGRSRLRRCSIAFGETAAQVAYVHGRLRRQLQAEIGRPEMRDS